ncbi:hypothetical protein AS885_07740 [Flavobacterium psychrophilum]|nr:hypothetical protein FPSM_02573 [Flavobacterium psychrophilum]KUM16944.1 hypothetical protein ATB91_12010 [Flavobacterium psychrophilum]KUM20365.1 hypothetical protein AS885_07740 [Flavobacterium psychrophilum]KUM22804.1 hypothetical protein ATB90_06915 [Flavobacterium psychrophilum]
MQHIQGISRQQLQIPSLEDKITLDNAQMFHRSNSAAILPNRCACCTTKNKIQNQLFLCVLILITTVNQLVKNN